MTGRTSLTAAAAAGARWSFISVAGRRAVTLLTTLLLARLLAPGEFGLVAMAAVFINFVDVIRDLGTGKAIVQVEEAGEDLLSSLFWMNLALGAILATLLVALAPVAAVLLREPRLRPVLATLSVTTVLAACSLVHASLLSRQMRFRSIAVAELTGAVAGGSLGIAMALRGHGVWSLVWQTIATTGLSSAGTWIASGWRPRWIFRTKSVRPVLTFSANLTGFNVFNYFARNADNFLVGRYLGVQSLGWYDLAYRVMLYPLQIVSWTLGRALFPVYARMQQDPARLRSAYLRVTGAIALVAFPMITGLASIADPLIPALLGAPWTPATRLLLILAPVSALQAIGTTLGTIYSATGRTDLLLRWGGIISALLVASFVVGLRWDVTGVAAAYAIASFALAYPTFRPALRLINLPVPVLLATLARPMACSAAMLAVVLLLKPTLSARFDTPSLLLMLVASGTAVYAAATWLWNRQSLLELIDAAQTPASER